MPEASACQGRLAGGGEPPYDRGVRVAPARDMDGAMSDWGIDRVAAALLAIRSKPARPEPADASSGAGPDAEGQQLFLPFHEQRLGHRPLRLAPSPSLRPPAADNTQQLELYDMHKLALQQAAPHVKRVYALFKRLRSTVALGEIEAALAAAIAPKNCRESETIAGWLAPQDMQQQLDRDFVSLARRREDLLKIAERLRTSGLVSCGDVVSSGEDGLAALGESIEDVRKLRAFLFEQGLRFGMPVGSQKTA